MTLYTDFIFLTDEIEGFKMCRDTRFDSSVTVLLCLNGHIDVGYRGEMIRIAKDDIFIRVPRATEKGPFNHSDDFEFKQITIPIQLFESLMFDLIRVEPLWWQKLEYLKENPIFHLQQNPSTFASCISLCSASSWSTNRPITASRFSNCLLASLQWSCSIIWISLWCWVIMRYVVCLPMRAIIRSRHSHSCYKSIRTNAKYSGMPRC